MEKPTMLLISRSSTTNVGMRSYLNHIFSKYIHLETCLAADVDTERMEKADLVLFSSRFAARMAEPLMTPKIRYLICIRTFNHTYLNRILSIPSNSEVYLVNDLECSAKDSIQLLYTLGITQYRFIPYYPGCPETDARIQYAVTVGENKLAPRNVQTLVDIGIWIADISTISEIASFFHLPLSLADVVSLNYINQFVQLLKISNHQLSQATNTKFITQSILSNIDTGVCIVDDGGKIQMINKQFKEALDIPRSHLVGTLLKEAVPELDGIAKRSQDQRSPFFLVRRGKEDPLKLAVQEIRDMDHRVLISGEPGTGREVLAQAIHNNSRRSAKPFMKLNLTVLSEGQIMEEMFPGDGREGILNRAEGGTLYLNGIHCMSISMQKEFLNMMDQMPDVRFIASTEEDLYTMCQEGRFLKSLFYMIGEVSLETFPIRQRPEDIPLLFEYFIRNIYNNSALRWTDMCSEELWNSLTAYSWPGNGKEIENLCKYVYCFHSEGKLTIRDLPAYIRLQMAKKASLLSPLEKRVLQTVAQNPKIGRAGLQEILENEGIQVAEGKIRSILQSLSEQGLIKVNRTRGGCEITETGELQLE
ncbi:MAG: sigma 54-interacting transcriptional regulator [Clostridium sp.]|nr:sigma 54-interacting transcriptional regulator [Clostridium sp.]